MIEPCQAIGLVPTMRGIRRSAYIGFNLDHSGHLIKAASWLSSLNLPVRPVSARSTCRGGRQTASAAWPGSGTPT